VQPIFGISEPEPYGVVVMAKAKQSRLKNEPTYNYAVVEAALGKVFEVGAHRRDGGNLPVLKARLKTLHRAGLTPSRSPGRGKVIRYRRRDIYDKAVACALADFGLTPEPITQFLELPWHHSLNYEHAARAPADNHLFIVLMPHVLKWRSFNDLEYLLMNGKDISGAKITALGGRYQLIDLTALLAAVDAALADYPIERAEILRKRAAARARSRRVKPPLLLQEAQEA
jgi:hypothetical protein